MVNRRKKISIDCMGGDYAPDIVIHGLSQVINFDISFDFNLFGDEDIIKSLIDKYKIPSDRVSIFQAGTFNVHADTKPSFAIKNALNSSMGMAINSVKNAESDACISAGNTGAYMGLAKIILKMLPGLERPAIASAVPTRKNNVIILDLGANAECSGNNLVEFALMGEALFKAEFGKEAPSVAVLNIGSEHNKGNTLVKYVANELSSKKILKNFVGFIEGDQIFNGDVDVIVTDGFCGNVTLKVMEGVAKLIFDEIKTSFSHNMFSSLAGLIAKPFLKKHLIKKLDPKLYNGAVLLGVNGIVVKSHGGTDSAGFGNAIKFTINVVKNDLIANTAEILSKRSTD